MGIEAAERSSATSARQGGAGTITVKMAPRIRKLWDQIPEPKWCIAMGACAISGNYFRDLYATVPGIDTMVPVDVYIPGCPPAADDVMAGLKRLQCFCRQRPNVAGVAAPLKELLVLVL